MTKDKNKKYSAKLQETTSKCYANLPMGEKMSNNCIEKPSNSIPTLTILQVTTLSIFYARILA